MSRETEKIFRELHKFIEENSAENQTEADMEKLMNEFMTKYNGSVLEKVTAETAKSSYDYLELANDAATDKEALKYAKEALKIDPCNYDAESIVLDLKEEDNTSLVKKYAKSVKKATAHMEEEGFFDEECIGNFWGIMETRPYMRLRVRYVTELIECKMLGQAKEECRELLRLCEGDNMGLRYVLMHIYAYFEDEDAALALHEQFGSYDETQMLLPLSILYYKKGQFTKAGRYLKKLYAVNKDLKRFLAILSGDSDEDFLDFEFVYGYRPGTIEELMVELRDNDFLFMGMDAYMEWALQRLKG